ncbi:XdhC family protein [Novosphingobium sp. FSY-8]|uniref:XdhC family protein n=1 Tax=Novosphingobium ovatum TaxID=1908523 RepID=A0ABW9X9K0_9SPHN|nr:XdhC family protein [Novosphingobium ovatum]NBC35188.1 XdhC family protein [Novosphingobium ovatum]
MTHTPAPTPLADDDLSALYAVADHGGALCTVVGIDGSWSRRLGAQLAVLPNGTMRGSLADGCLERALADQALAGGAARVLRYGAGSPFIDIRLPCGSGVEVMVDPAPDADAVAQVVADLHARRVGRLAVGDTPGGHFTRTYAPPLRLIVMGSGPELRALAGLAMAQGVAVLTCAPMGEPADIALSLGQPPALPDGWQPDPWTAVVVLFHDHEWERTLIPWALRSDGFYVGAQGGARTRASRADYLRDMGLTQAATGRLRSPVGLIPAARTPSVLALSIMAELVAAHEAAISTLALDQLTNTSG